MLSVHVKVTLQNSLLKGIRLWSFRLSRRLLDRRSLDRRLRHLRNRFRPVVNGAPGWGGGGKREGSPRSTDDGTLGTRPKLLGPVETLLVIAGASIWANVAHVRSAKAHSSNEWCCGCSLGVHVVIFNGTLINRIRVIRVCRHAASTNERGVCGRSARKTKRGHGETSTTRVNWTRGLIWKAIAVGNRVPSLKEIGQGGLGDRSSSVACVHIGVGVIVGGYCVCGHDGRLRTTAVVGSYSFEDAVIWGDMRGNGARVVREWQQQRFT